MVKIASCRAAISLAAVTALLAGCGTTANLRSSNAGGDTSGLALAAPGGSGAAAATGPAIGGSTATSAVTVAGSAGTASAAAAGSALPATGGAVTGAANPGAGPAGVAGSGGASAPGPSGSAPVEGGAPIKVGFVVLKGGGAVLSAIGAGTPLAFGDGQVEAQAVVDHINKTGGITGRQVQAVYATWDASSGASGLTAACTQLTEDDHVSVILDVINVTQDFVSCAAQHQTVLVNASFGPGDDTIYQQFGQYFYSPSLEDLDREERLVLTVMNSAGKFAKSRVGIAYDATDPQYKRVLQRTVQPMLGSLHVPYESYGIAQQSDIQGAVLKFAADGVNQVVWIAPSGVEQLLFMQAANTQGYHPGYGLGDSSDTWFLGQEAPAAEVKGIFGAGTLPVSNVPVSAYPTTGAEASCLSLMRAAGENDTDRHTSLTATLYCELGYELKAVMSHLQGPVTAASWAAAYRAVGTSYAPLTTFSEDLASGRNGGADAYRELGYSAACSCVAYLGPTTPMAF